MNIYYTFILFQHSITYKRKSQPASRQNHKMNALVCQIAYDISGGGTQFREAFGVTLGWWHCYKQANLLLWRFAAPHFFGPMFHMMVPRSKFKKNPKLFTIATYLSYIRLAYPKFRHQLATAINYPGVTPNNKRHLNNLLTLCEYFIPVVSRWLY